MPLVAASAPELLAALAGLCHIDGERLGIDDEPGFRDRGIRDVAWTAAFATDPGAVETAQWIVWEAAQELGAHSASIQDLYMARARGEVSGFTVPAINIRAQTFDMARTVYEAAEAGGVGAVILELARSEQTYTFQRPIDYATSVLAGAVAAGWHGPVFLQGDHYQFNAKKYAADPETMTEEIRRACRLAVDAGYRNIDIDSSTLVDLSLPTVDDQQRANYERAAELTALIRTLETDGVTISVGGEIGEVGKENSNEAELRAFLDGYRRELDARSPGALGISKVSVQTGTSHGGMVLPDGTVGTVAVDFKVHERLGAVARTEYGLAGTVQHGASTLPDELFHRFREVETAEIHLATGLPEPAVRPSGVPAGAPRRDRALVRRERRGRAQGRPDRPAVHLHVAQEDDRAVQARALGPLDEGRDPGGPAGEDRLPVPRARGRRRSRHGGPLHPPGRRPSAAARGAPGVRRRRLTAPARGAVAYAGFLVDAARCGAPMLPRKLGAEGGCAGHPRVLSPQRSAPRRGAPFRTTGGRGGSSWRVLIHRTSPRATTPICARSGSSPSCSGGSASCRTSRWRSATSASRPGRSRSSPSALGVGGPAFFWSWPLVILGQTFVALNFAELSEPLPGRRIDLPVVEAPVATRRSAGSPAGSTSGPASSP